MERLGIEPIYDWIFEHPNSKFFHPCWSIMGWSENKKGQVRIKVRGFADDTIIDGVSIASRTDILNLHNAVVDAKRKSGDYPNL